ncbi:conserved Plasmodium protein, unknown function [Plasmodium malariae]|uniref:Uncharacterized protein n=1 Tax=Plasmodium malariae TaxID=5858 RepID=A0A1A8W1Z2_PLAMA|nr:conserved Plasmodium protein, unknown function [Plasmodium malariae]
MKKKYVAKRCKNCNRKKTNTEYYQSIKNTCKKKQIIRRQKEFALNKYENNSYNYEIKNYKSKLIINVSCKSCQGTNDPFTQDRTNREMYQSNYDECKCILSLKREKHCPINTTDCVCKCFVSKTISAREGRRRFFEISTHGQVKPESLNRYITERVKKREEKSVKEESVKNIDTHIKKKVSCKNGSREYKECKTFINTMHQAYIKNCKNSSNERPAISSSAFTNSKQNNHDLFHQKHTKEMVSGNGIRENAIPIIEGDIKLLGKGNKEREKYMNRNKCDEMNEDRTAVNITETTTDRLQPEEIYTKKNRTIELVKLFNSNNNITEKKSLLTYINNLKFTDEEYERERLQHELQNYRFVHIPKKQGKQKQINNNTVTPSLNDKYRKNLIFNAIYKNYLKNKNKCAATFVKKNSFGSKEAVMKRVLNLLEHSRDNVYKGAGQNWDRRNNISTSAITGSGTIGSGTIGSSAIGSGTIGSGTIGSGTIGSSAITCGYHDNCGGCRTAGGMLKHSVKNNVAWTNPTWHFQQLSRINIKRKVKYLKKNRIVKLLAKNNNILVNGLRIYPNEERYKNVISNIRNVLVRRRDILSLPKFPISLYELENYKFKLNTSIEIPALKVESEDINFFKYKNTWYELFFYNNHNNKNTLYNYLIMRLNFELMVKQIKDIVIVDINTIHFNYPYIYNAYLIPPINIHKTENALRIQKITSDNSIINNGAWTFFRKEKKKISTHRYDSGGYDSGGCDSGGYDSGGYDSGGCDSCSYDKGSIRDNSGGHNVANNDESIDCHAYVYGDKRIRKHFSYFLNMRRNKYYIENCSVKSSTKNYFAHLTNYDAPKTRFKRHTVIKHTEDCLGEDKKVKNDNRNKEKNRETDYLPSFLEYHKSVKQGNAKVDVRRVSSIFCICPHLRNDNGPGRLHKMNTIQNSSYPTMEHTTLSKYSELMYKQRAKNTFPDGTTQSDLSNMFMTFENSKIEPVFPYISRNLFFLFEYYNNYLNNVISLFTANSKKGEFLFLNKNKKQLADSVAHNKNIKMYYKTLQKQYIINERAKKNMMNGIYCTRDIQRCLSGGRPINRIYPDIKENLKFGKRITNITDINNFKIRNSINSKLYDSIFHHIRKKNKEKIKKELYSQDVEIPIFFWIIFGGKDMKSMDSLNTVYKILRYATEIPPCEYEKFIRRLKKKKIKKIWHERSNNRNSHYPYSHDRSPDKPTGEDTCYNAKIKGIHITTNFQKYKEKETKKVFICDNFFSSDIREFETYTGEGSCGEPKKNIISKYVRKDVNNDISTNVGKHETTKESTNDTRDKKGINKFPDLPKKIFHDQNLYVTASEIYNRIVTYYKEYHEKVDTFGPNNYADFLAYYNEKKKKNRKREKKEKEKCGHKKGVKGTIRKDEQLGAELRVQLGVNSEVQSVLQSVIRAEEITQREGKNRRNDIASDRSEEDKIVQNERERKYSKYLEKNHKYDTKNNSLKEFEKGEKKKKKKKKYVERCIHNYTSPVKEYENNLKYVYHDKSVKSDREEDESYDLFLEGSENESSDISTEDELFSFISYHMQGRNPSFEKKGKKVKKEKLNYTDIYGPIIYKNKKKNEKKEEKQKEKQKEKQNEKQKQRQKVKYAFLLLDYPAYNNSTGHPSPLTFKTNALTALKEALKEIKKTDHGNSSISINMVGYSLGCSVSLQLLLDIAKCLYNDFFQDSNKIPFHKKEKEPIKELKNEGHLYIKLNNNKNINNEYVYDEKKILTFRDMFFHKLDDSVDDSCTHEIVEKDKCKINCHKKTIFRNFRQAQNYAIVLPSKLGNAGIEVQSESNRNIRGNNRDSVNEGGIGIHCGGKVGIHSGGSNGKHSGGGSYKFNDNLPKKSSNNGMDFAYETPVLDSNYNRLKSRMSENFKNEKTSINKVTPKKNAPINKKNDKKFEEILKNDINITVDKVVLVAPFTNTQKLVKSVLNNSIFFLFSSFIMNKKCSYVHWDNIIVLKELFKIINDFKKNKYLSKIFHNLQIDFIHGQKDTLVNYEMSLKLYNLTNKLIFKYALSNIECFLYIFKEDCHSSIFNSDTENRILQIIFKPLKLHPFSTTSIHKFHSTLYKDIYLLKTVYLHNNNNNNYNNSSNNNNNNYNNNNNNNNNNYNNSSNNNSNNNTLITMMIQFARNGNMNINAKLQR